MGHSGGRTGRSGLLVALALGLASCTSANGSYTPTSSPSTTVDITDSPAPSQTPTVETAEEQVAALWEAVHETRLAQIYRPDDPDEAAFADIATIETQEDLATLVQAARGDVPLDFVEAEYWPDIEISTSGSAAIADCILVATRPSSQPEDEPSVRSQVWTGTVEPTSDGYLLSSISIGEGNCVPAELNRQLLEAYRDYHEAWTTAWDPPDPDHPLLEETMTGQRLEGIRELLREDRDAGIAFRDPHDPLTDAVVFALKIGHATVSDCHQADPGYGAFDAESGERLDDEVPPVEPGELHLTSVDLVRDEEGEWKVADAALLTDSDCEPRGTDHVVAP